MTSNTISIPSGGLSLSEFPIDHSARRGKIKQAIEIASLGDDSLDKIVSSIRDGVEATVSLGKKPVIILDKKAIPLKTTYQSQSLLFQQSQNSSKLELVASLNLKDALARARLARSRDIDMNDPAIMALQASMAQVKEQKDANQTIVVKSSNLSSSKNGKSTLSSLKNHRQGMFGGSANTPSRSLPGSPAMAGGATPQPTRRDARTIKQEALKRSFIHLLAVRAVSQKYMSSVLHATASDLEPLLEKYGKKSIDGTKYNLSDRGYKELDPWAFPYKDESDRDAVIDRTITAFDRLRISVGDPLWQKLNKKEDRGKGKTLSRLSNLSSGPVERVKTPKIQVDASTDDQSKSNNTERGRLLAPSDAVAGSSAARSKSQESTTKKPVKTTATTTKPGDKSTAEMAQSKAQKTADKKKESPKKVDAKKPVVKKPATSKAATPSGKVKSAEFIEDSDEEIESDEIAKQSINKNKRKAVEDLSPASKKLDTKKATPKPSPKPVVEKVISKSKPALEKPVKRPQDDPAKRSSSSQPSSQSQSSTKKKLPEAQRPVAMARSISAKKGTSPVKPSPLGSSPPTNASDLEQEKNKINKAGSIKSSSSSSSGSPLINQRRERLQLEAQRKAAAPSPSLNSDKNLKRRVNDLENGNHPNGGFSRTSTSSSEQPSKRTKRADSSASASESDQRSNASSNTTPSLALSPQDLDYARLFKTQWQKYTSALRELQALSDPPPERVEKLQKLYDKLKDHKAEICSWEKKLPV